MTGTMAQGEREEEVVRRDLALTFRRKEERRRVRGMTTFEAKTCKQPLYCSGHSHRMIATVFFNPYANQQR
jgi:hypothetical protein